VERLPRFSWRRGRPFSNGRCVVYRFENKERVIMTSGTIKKVVSERGFGFIAAEDGKEYFFHRGGLEAPLDFDRLSGGEKVSFEIETSPKGPRAVRVSAV
jgi:CspA family cold shock protein